MVTDLDALQDRDLHIYVNAPVAGSRLRHISGRLRALSPCEMKNSGHRVSQSQAKCTASAGISPKHISGSSERLQPLQGKQGREEGEVQARHARK